MLTNRLSLHTNEDKNDTILFFTRSKDREVDEAAMKLVPSGMIAQPHCNGISSQWTWSIVLLVLSTLSYTATAQLQQAFATSAGNAPLASQLGAAYVNIASYNWRSFQRTVNSPYDWTSLDADVQALQSRGLDIYFTIQCVSPIGSVQSPCAVSYSNSNGIYQSWFPEDTLQWKLFLGALVDRYDKNGTNDMPGLLRAIMHWHIEQEWSRIWCSPYSDTSLDFVQEFTRYANMTYGVIKDRQPGAMVSVAGIDARHDLIAFYDGYSSFSAMCLSPSCDSQGSATRAQLSANFEFMANRRNVLYLLRNARSDEIDIHQYGRWQEIPYVVKWLKDSAALGNRSVIFLEGGGPFCKACEPTYHPASDVSGNLPPQLVRDNASYVVYYYITGLASGVKQLHWHLAPEYSLWGATFGDLDLVSKDSVRKPSYFTYRYLAAMLKDLNADTVLRIPASDASLYYYRIEPKGVSVLWSTKLQDTVTLAANGLVLLSHVPTVMGDTVVHVDTLRAQGKVNITLSEGVPVIVSGVGGLVGVSPMDKDRVPTGFELFQNYPNPFNPGTAISFEIAQRSNVEIRIYNSLGQLTRSVLSEQKERGRYSVSWDGRDNSGKQVASGTYYCQISVAGFLRARKLIVLR